MQDGVGRAGLGFEPASVPGLAQARHDVDPVTARTKQPLVLRLHPTARPHPHQQGEGLADVVQGEGGGGGLAHLRWMRGWVAHSHALRSARAARGWEVC